MIIPSAGKQARSARSRPQPYAWIPLQSQEKAQEVKVRCSFWLSCCFQHCFAKHSVVLMKGMPTLLVIETAPHPWMLWDPGLHKHGGSWPAQPHSPPQSALALQRWDGVCSAPTPSVPVLPPVPWHPQVTFGKARFVNQVWETGFDKRWEHSEPQGKPTLPII